MPRKLKTYELWKGNVLIAKGSAKEIAQQTGLKENTIRRYMTPAYMEKQKKKKKADRGYTTKDVTKYTKEERAKVKEIRKKARERRKARDKPPKPSKHQLANILSENLINTLKGLNISPNVQAELESAIKRGFEELDSAQMYKIMSEAVEDVQDKHFYEARQLAKRITGQIYVAIGNKLDDPTLMDIGEELIDESEWSDNMGRLE